MAGGAIGIKLSPLWYVIDSCPMISAPPNGSGTETKIFFFKFTVPKTRYNFTTFHFDSSLYQQSACRLLFPRYPVSMDLSEILCLEEKSRMF